MIAAPLLALLGTALGISGYHATGTAFVNGMVAHSHWLNIAMQCSQAAMILLILAVAGLGTMATATRPGWGRGAAVVTIIGLTGPISFESLYWGAWHITDTPAHRAAAALMMDRSQVIPRSVMNVSGPALVIGFVLLGIAVAKAGVLGRARAVCLGVTAIIPAGFISGHLVISLIGFLGTAIALVPLGVELLRPHGDHAA
ncbi:MAG: hypothetical protein ACRDPI_03910 [Nocardioidaceae bacterium]